MSTKKIIKINPELFNLGSEKTKKQREKRERPTPALIINSNSLKKQLLNRIKEHKIKEKSELDEQNPNKDKGVGGGKQEEEMDEFYDSIHYLSSLSKKHKENNEKRKYDTNVQKNRESLARKTVKNPNIYVTPSSINSVFHQPPSFNNSGVPMPEYSTSVPYSVSVTTRSAPSHPLFVNLELPEELKEPFKTNDIDSFIEGIKLNYGVDNSVPYGCLKGGVKPTYRNWNLTKKQIPSITPITPSTNVSGVPSLFATLTPGAFGYGSLQIPDKPMVISERERKLDILKNRIKKQQDDDKLEKIMISQNLITPSTNVSGVGASRSANIVDANIVDANIVDANIVDAKLIKTDKPIVEKQFIKKTIKRKFTLGKSKLYRRVSILIKDKNTRKNVINAHKELKKKPINDVKKYLKEHGLIKAGSNAPNDVVRKIYESSMLTGDIINKNKDTLLHNFLSDASEELHS